MTSSSDKLWIMLCGLVLIFAGALPHAALAADTRPVEKLVPIPLTIPVAGMRGDADDHSRVSGLALTVEDHGWPAFTMLGHPNAVLGALTRSSDVPHALLVPKPLAFGTIRLAGDGQLVDQQINQVTNTLTFRGQNNASLQVTITRLSPAILLQTTSTQLELFAQPSNDINGRPNAGASPMRFDPDHQQVVPDTNRPQNVLPASPFPPPAGTVKPLRWAVPTADGKVLTGILGRQPSVLLPFKDWHDRFAAAPSLAPTLPSTPPTDGLAQHWLLLWYGSDSPFLSSKVPVVIGGTGLYALSPWRMATVFQADVPFLFVFDSAPQSVSFSPTGELTVKLATPGGKIVMLPLFGHDLPGAATTETWLRDFPADLKARCDDWTARLGAFPTNVTEEIRRDDQADRVSSTETFEYIQVRPNAAKTALLRPMLALGLQQKLPAQITPVPLDLKYATQFGPLLAVAGDHYQWSLDGLGKVVEGHPAIGPTNENSKELEQELSTEVDKVLAAGHLAPWITSRQAPWWIGCASRNGADPSEVLYLLSEVLPLLPEAQQAKVRQYLAGEASAYPPEKVLQLDINQGARRDFFLVPKNILAQFNWPLGQNSVLADEYYENTPSLFRAYGVARFLRATGGKPSSDNMEFWRNTMHASLGGREWDTMGWYWGKYAVDRGDWNTKKVPESQYSDIRRNRYLQFTLRAAHRDAAGLVGYLRLCQLARQDAEPQAWGQLARLLALRFSLARYGRYLADSGLFHMPDDPAATAYLGRSGDFTRPEAHLEQVGEVTQHEVTMYYGVSREIAEFYVGFNRSFPYGCSVNYQTTFLDLTPEVAHVLANWGLQDDVAGYLNRYAELQSVWYKAHAENLHFCTGEQAGTLPNDSYQLFLAHAWIAATPPEKLERYIDVPWTQCGDFYYMHKLAETIKAYRGVRWEAEVQ